MITLKILVKNLLIVKMQIFIQLVAFVKKLEIIFSLKKIKTQMIYEQK